MPGFVALILVASAVADNPTFDPSEEIRTFVAQAEKSHISHRPLDDRRAAQWFDRFLENLDPRRMYFLESDNGIYLLDGDTLMICVGKSGAIGRPRGKDGHIERESADGQQASPDRDDRPEVFESNKSNGQGLFIFKRDRSVAAAYFDPIAQDNDKKTRSAKTDNICLLTCQCDLKETTPRKWVASISLRNDGMEDVAIDSLGSEHAREQLSQLYLIIDGRKTSPKIPTEDVWPYAESVERPQLNQRKALVVPAHRSVEVYSTEFEWPEKAREVVLWAQVFLPRRESSIQHRLGARGPVLKSNTYVMRADK
jgi:hypothetical protein